MAHCKSIHSSPYWSLNRQNRNNVLMIYVAIGADGIALSLIILAITAMPYLSFPIVSYILSGCFGVGVLFLGNVTAAVVLLKFIASLSKQKVKIIVNGTPFDPNKHLSLDHLIHIFHFLEFPDLSAFSQTSHSSYDAFQSYCIEFAKEHGYRQEDIIQSKAFIRSALQSLIFHEVIIRSCYRVYYDEFSKKLASKQTMYSLCETPASKERNLFQKTPSSSVVKKNLRERIHSLRCSQIL